MVKGPESLNTLSVQQVHRGVLFGVGEHVVGLANQAAGHIGVRTVVDPNTEHSKLREVLAE